MDEGARKARRNGEKEQFWRAALREAEASGKSVRAFCAEKGLKENLLYAWRRELKLRDAEGRQAPGFVEVLRRGGAEGRGGVSIRLGNGLSIEVERGFDAPTLKAALAVIGEVGA
jgi:hypothetical protein